MFQAHKHERNICTQTLEQNEHCAGFGTLTQNEHSTGLSTLTDSQALLMEVIPTSQFAAAQNFPFLHRQQTNGAQLLVFLRFLRRNRSHHASSSFRAWPSASRAARCDASCAFRDGPSGGAALNVPSVQASLFASFVAPKERFHLKRKFVSFYTSVT